ncbi:MAG TPA: hypothetical protein VGK84_00070 [Candidatus Tumulicola sp.]
MAFLAGCSSGSITPPSQSSQATSTSKTGDDFLFVSNSIKGKVEIYKHASKSVYRTITTPGRPQGLAIDGSGDLYVANGSEDYVNVYAPPYKSASSRLEVGQYSNGVATSPLSGEVVVIVSDELIVFGKGGQEPCFHYDPPGYSELSYAAFDSADNLYFDGLDASGNVLISVAHIDCGTPFLRMLKTGNEFLSPGILAVGRDERLSILDPAARAVYTYGRLKVRALGNPIFVTPLNGESVKNPVAFVFANEGKVLFTADHGSGFVDQFPFRSGGHPAITYSINGKPSGVAVAPAFVP